MNTFFVHLLNSAIYYKKAKHYDTLVSNYDYHACLNHEEKRKIQFLWKDVSLKGVNPYKWHSFYKAFCGYFDEKFIPSTIYNGLFENTLNIGKFSSFLQHKGYLHAFIESQYRCKTLLNYVNDKLYDGDMHLISKEYTIESLQQAIGDSIIIKPSTGSGGGRGVKLLKKTDLETLETEELFSDGDFIAQEYLSECEDLKRFNPDTVNTIRLLSLNINGTCSVLSSFLRIGSKGMHIDNLSAGGILVGIKPNGYLHEFALDKSLNKIYTSPSGITFKNTLLTTYSYVREFAIVHHNCFPMANLIAWDFAVDKKNNVIVIEINLDSGEIQFHQIFNGPLFGDRTNEVIQWVKTHMGRRYIIK